MRVILDAMYQVWCMRFENGYVYEGNWKEGNGLGRQLYDG